MKGQAVVSIGQGVIQSESPVGIIEDPAPSSVGLTRSPETDVPTGILVVKEDLGDLIVEEIIATMQALN